MGALRKPWGPSGGQEWECWDSSCREPGTPGRTPGPTPGQEDSLPPPTPQALPLGAWGLSPWVLSSGGCGPPPTCAQGALRLPPLPLCYNMNQPELQNLVKFHPFLLLDSPRQDLPVPPNTRGDPPAGPSSPLPGLASAWQLPRPPGRVESAL